MQRCGRGSLSEHAGRGFLLRRQVGWREGWMDGGGAGAFKRFSCGRAFNFRNYGRFSNTRLFILPLNMKSGT